MCPPRGTLAPIPTREFALPPSQLSPPARIPGRNNGRHNERRNDIRKRHSSLDFDFLSFRFRDRPACPVPRCGGLTRHTMFTIDTTTASGQPVRFFCLVRTTTATRPAWFPRHCIPSFCARVPVPLSQVRFNPMTIAQRTTLSNQLRLCRIPKHSRRRGRLQRHVRSEPPGCPPFSATHRDTQARKEPRWTPPEHPGS